MNRRLITIAFVFFLFSCAAAPVQQMSDARQAIKMAQQAGAESYAQESIRQARVFLERAQQKLEMGSYRAARESAELAQKRAIEAMKQAQESGVSR